ncbi:hypothetical protein [Mesorhizobium sp. P5_C1]
MQLQNEKPPDGIDLDAVAIAGGARAGLIYRTIYIVRSGMGIHPNTIEPRMDAPTSLAAN